MKIIKIWNENPSERQICEICDNLEKGELIICPTDTVYGIMCDIFNSKAIERICRLKRINAEKTNLSIICNDISMAAEYSRIDNRIFRLIKDNTPGAFTFLLRTNSHIPRAFKGRRIVGIRIPDNNICREITGHLGHPVMTTSIEFEDADQAVSPGLIVEKYEAAVETMIVGEDGKTGFSTIIDCSGTEPKIIREGLGKID